MDLYRIESENELATLALEDVLGEIEPGIVIVEWSERLTIRSEWPVVRIEMEHLGNDVRRHPHYRPLDVAQPIIRL